MERLGYNLSPLSLVLRGGHEEKPGSTFQQRDRMFPMFAAEKREERVQPLP
jgi:hypothetical protein